MIPVRAVPWVQVLNCTLSSSKRSQIGAHLSTGTTEHSKEEVGIQKVAELEEKLPDQIQSLKKVDGCFLCLRTKKCSNSFPTLLLCLPQGD